MNIRISDWTGKRVWIIGASTGIGAETARLLLAKGASVALSARRLDCLIDVANAHPNASIHPLDITDHASVLAVRDAIGAQWPTIDLVLVVAGTYNEMRADAFDMAIANRLLDLNFRGVLHCLDAVLPILLRQN